MTLVHAETRRESAGRGLQEGVYRRDGRPPARPISAFSSWQILATQVFDGAANGLFAVVAAAWVTGRMNDRGRLGTAQVFVGVSIVVGASLGPAVAAALVGPLGFRGMFAIQCALGLAGSLILLCFVPECRTATQPAACMEESPAALKVQITRDWIRRHSGDAAIVLTVDLRRRELV